VDSRCTLRCSVGTLWDIAFLVVGALPEGDLNIQYLRCIEPGIAFGIKDLSEHIDSSSAFLADWPRCFRYGPISAAAVRGVLYVSMQ
jgi:hypothetical protein